MSASVLARAVRGLNSLPSVAAGAPLSSVSGRVPSRQIKCAKCVCNVIVQSRGFKQVSWRGAVDTMNVPKFDAALTEGVLAEITKQAGEYAKEDDVLCVIETDKVCVEVCPRSCLSID